ncbi:hypothetical protein CB1_000357026 [Camelus ferus]|nr:hypothetical protein CB1_000357026 [Camelus ferus]
MESICLWAIQVVVPRVLLPTVTLSQGQTAARGMAEAHTLVEAQHHRAPGTAEADPSLRRTDLTPPCVFSEHRESSAVLGAFRFCFPEELRVLLSPSWDVLNNDRPGGGGSLPILLYFPEIRSNITATAGLSRFQVFSEVKSLSVNFVNKSL